MSSNEAESGTLPAKLRERELWAEFQEFRDEVVRGQLIELYLPLAQRAAARAYGMRINQSVSFDDYLQYARMGLIEAVDRFDAGRGVAFEVYSVRRIRGAILNGIGQESEVAAQYEFWRTRDPDRLQSLVEGIRDSPEQASLDELAEMTMGLALGVLLDEPAADGPVDETTRANPYAATELDQLSRLVRSFVEKLPERERDIVQRHYFQHMEFQEIAEHYSISKGRVSQLHGSALKLLYSILVERPHLDRKL